MMTGKMSQDNYPQPEGSDSTVVGPPMEWELSKAERRWGLTLRRPSMQRKHAEHARHLPSRTLAGAVDDTQSGRRALTSAAAYATMRAHKHHLTPAEAHAMNIVSHMELDDDLMLDDPISEQLRLEKLRDLPQCLTVKRSVKAHLTTSVNQKKKRKPITFWKRLKYRISMSFMKIGMALHEVASTLELWYHPIKQIEGHFGSGVATYFKFLRWLFTFNIICCILSIGFVVFPQSLLEVSAGDYFSGWDILTGGGFFTNSIMYYGFYSNGTVSQGSGPVYSIPTAYFMTLLCCYVFTFLLLSIKVARSYRKSFIETAGGVTNVYANKIFCGWDFGIASYRAANLRSATIYGELKELLGDRQKQRTNQDCATRSYVLLIQSAITALIITVMSVTGILLWMLLTTYEVDRMNTLLILVIPLSITIVMNIYPAFFSWLVQFEGYASKRTALYVTMIRIYVMELVILGVLLSFWLSNTTDICWQTAFTQEIYRLVIIDFIISIVGVFAAQMIRSKLYLMAWKKLGAPKFDIARNTLNLTYNQTLFWIVFYFSPLMSVVIIVKLILTFYIKKYGVLNHCEPPSQSWRAAQTQTLFLALAFLSMVGVLSVLGYIVTSVPTEDCGPFRGYEYTWEMVVQGVLQLREDSKFWVFVTMIAKPGVGAAILISMCVAVYYLRAKAQARKDMVQILRGMLVMEAHDKDFLLSGISRVEEEQRLYRPKPVVTPRSSLANNPQARYYMDSPQRRRTHNKQHYAVSESRSSSINHEEPSNSLPSFVLSDSFRDNTDGRNGSYMELSNRYSHSSEGSSVRSSSDNGDAKAGITRQYNFKY